MPPRRRWTEFRERRRQRREIRRYLRADRKGRKHDFDPGRSYGDLWKSGGGRN
jgi:hypothetical protein